MILSRDDRWHLTNYCGNESDQSCVCCAVEKGTPLVSESLVTSFRLSALLAAVAVYNRLFVSIVLVVLTVGAVGFLFYSIVSSVRALTLESG